MSSPATNPPIPTVTVPPPPPPPPPPGRFGATRSLTGADRDGLRKISNGALIGIFGSAANVAIGIALDFSGLTRTLELRAGFPGWTSWIWLIALLAFGVVLTLIELTWMRDGLRRLPGPSPELAGPISVSRLVYPGLLLLWVGLTVVLVTLGSFLTCSPSGVTPGMMTCVRTGALWPLLVGVGIALVGGILTVVGWIYLAIGLWRLERRYQQSLIQVGAILLILFPLLGDILLWVGIHQVLETPNAPPG